MISHAHRCIFIHIPKCAGQSIETAFLEDLGLDWATRAVLLLRPNDRPEIGPPRLAHLIARDYLRHHYLSRELFDSYFKFAVVRNPWERAVSTYRYLNINESFDDFVDRLTRSCSEGEADSEFWFFRPQVDFVMDEAGTIVVDSVVHFENIATEFSHVAATVNLQAPLRHVNGSGPGALASNKKVRRSRRPLGFLRRLRRPRAAVGPPDKRIRQEHWRDFYNDETRAKVSEIYAQDIKSFGYSFETDCPAGKKTS